MNKGGPEEIQAELGGRGVGDLGVGGVLVAGDALRVGVVAGFDLEDAAGFGWRRRWLRLGEWGSG